MYRDARNYKGPSSYWEAQRCLGKRDTWTVPGIRSTTVERINAERIALRYHYTNVVTWCSNGDMILNTGGWHTPATKRRLLQGANTNVWIHDGHMLIQSETTGDTYFFEDGCVKKSDGTIEGCQPIVIQKYNEVFGFDLETRDEVQASLARLNDRNLRYAWRLMGQFHRFIAANCRIDVLPTLIGHEEVADIVAQRLGRE